MTKIKCAIKPYLPLLLSYEINKQIHMVGILIKTKRNRFYSDSALKMVVACNNLNI